MTSAATLFQPFRIRNLEIRNRFVMTGVGSGLPSEDGSVTDAYIAYFTERAKGGAGLLITEVVRPCDGHALTAKYQLSAAHDYLIPGIKKLGDAVHKYGAKIFLQLHHPGRETFDEILAGIPAVAPSPIPCPVNKATTRALEVSEIKELVKQFGAAAYRIQQADIDGVELHGGHGYLIHEFLSPWTNRRDDEYGGDFERRFRFLDELIAEIRKTCGRDFPLAIRFPLEDFMGDKAIDVELGVRIARRLAQTEVDLLDATVGLYETGISHLLEPMSHHQGWRNGLLERLAEEKIGLPILAVNAIRSLAFAEWIVDHHLTDLVGMGRPFLADPEWVNKAQEGRTKEIRPCLSCVYCVESLRHNAAEDGSGERNTCAVNARTYKESFYVLPKKDESLSYVTVAVVGSGPAGAECALMLSERGFTVDLYEAGTRIGGQLGLATKPKNKYRIEALIAYYERMLRKNKVNILLNTEADKEGLLSRGYQAIFVATGSLPVLPMSIPGITRTTVYTPEDILTERVRPRNECIAVIGSGLTGLETAEYLAERSNVVYVFDMLPEIGQDIYFQLKEDVLWSLKQNAVDFFPSHRLVSILENEICLEDLSSNTEKCFAVDGLVLSLGMRPNDQLYRELKTEAKIPVLFLGDATGIGRIKDAIHTGYQSAYTFQQGMSLAGKGNR